MDPKDKNQKVSQEQQALIAKKQASEQRVETLKTMDPTKLREQLSKRNEDYVFRLEKNLRAEGLTPGDATEKVNELLPEMILAQHKGQPANQLYGPPRIKTEKILHPEQKVSTLKFWMRAVDNATMYLAIFSGLMGLISAFQPPQKTASVNSSYGVVTVVVTGILMGALMAAYGDVIMRKKEDRPSWIKIIGVGFLGLIALFLIISGTQLLPPIANPVLPWWAMLIIAAISFIYRKIFRAHYHITESTLAPGADQNRRGARGQH